jgi:hypothetical protein
MESIVDHYLSYMNEGLNLDDPDYLQTIEKGPLQDDPTLRASFLIIEPDQNEDIGGYRQSVGAERKNKLKNVESAPQWEVGGGFLMLNYFKISGWSPQATSKQDSYTVIGRFTRRLERAIQMMARNEFALGVETDDGFETTGGMIQVFNLNGTSFKLVGGENEWYGKVTIHFAIYSKILNSYWQ